MDQHKQVAPSAQQPEFDREKVYAFLDGLRESGNTNMFGAAPFLAAAFYMTREESHKWLGEWMRDFGARHQ